MLRHLIRQEGWRQVLVFVATRHACDLVAHKLQKHGIQAAAFHADASQGARREVLRAFKAGELQVVVATDLAARGLHIDALPAVVNFDLPRSPDDHLHRIGRTARAGLSGVAVSFVNADTEAGARATYDSKSPNSNVNLEVGTKTYLDNAAFVKAKINNSGILCLGYTQALRPGVKASFGLALDTAKLSDAQASANAHKLGASVTFEA